MRFFATGMMERVMGAALPDDVPIESRMVTKAVEKAQTTVEQKNAEIRKNVLKYDEVMNEQRKVVYGLRDQILDAENLRDRAMQYLAEAVDGSIEAHCVSSVPDEWDLNGLLTQIDTFWPTRLKVEDLADRHSTDGLYDLLMGEATALYEEREEALTPDLMRQMERQILLSIVDQHWREHLYEMDYLREGIGLRAMGQRDPLTEWQREGFEMFQDMMQSVARDFVTYVMRAEVRVEQAPPAPIAPGTKIDWPGGDDSGDATGDATSPVSDAEPDVQDAAPAAKTRAKAAPKGRTSPAKAPAAAKPSATKAPAVRNLTYTSSDNADDPSTAKAAGRASRALQTAEALAGEPAPRRGPGAHRQGRHRPGRAETTSARAGAVRSTRPVTARPVRRPPSDHGTGAAAPCRH